MSDIALRLDIDGLAADLAVEANDLVLDDGLETAVILSLFTDRRADPSDLPDAQTDRRGWWADELGPDGDRIGSRLWLLAREKELAAVVSRAEQYAREALGWLVEDLVAERVEVSASIPRRGMLGLEVAIFRPSRTDPVRYRFDHVWEALAP